MTTPDAPAATPAPANAPSAAAAAAADAALRPTLTLPDGRALSVPAGTTIEQAIADHALRAPSPILAAYVENRIVRLDYPITRDIALRLVHQASLDGMMILERSLLFLLERALHDIFPSVSLTVNHSIDNRIFCELLMRIRGRREAIPPRPSDLERLTRHMRDAIEADLPVRALEVGLDEARDIFSRQGRDDKAALLKYRQKKHILLYELAGFYGHYHGLIAQRTGALRLFDLIPYENGFLLAMPKIEHPGILGEARTFPKLYNQYVEYEGWCERLGVAHVAHLNELVERGEAHELVLITEALQEKRFAQAADAILNASPRPRIICAAGPSSSGKTTTAARLRLQLKVLGIDAVPISLDDYFVDREHTPRDEHGNYDFEAFDAINAKGLSEDVARLINGEEVQLPKFSFQEGRSSPGRILRLLTGQVLLLEGIHGLNPHLLPTIPDALKFRLYISPLTAINLDETSRIRSSDVRIIRRMVRDHQFRGYSAEETLSRRPSLRRGEEKHIFPFQESADLMLNTSLAYELATLKPMAQPLLEQIPPDSPIYSESRRLLTVLAYFLPIPLEFVPTTSLLREFTGGSVFRH